MHQNPYALLGGCLRGTLPNPRFVGQSELALAIAQQVFGRRNPLEPSTSNVSGSGSGSSATDFVGCKVVLTANQGISGAPDTVTWDAAEFDTDSFWAASPNPSRITIPSGQGGVYLFVWHTMITGASDYDVRLYKNGVITATAYNSGTYAQYLCSHVDDCDAGDYFELKAADNTSTTFVGAALGTQRTYLSAYRIDLGINVNTDANTHPASPDSMDDEFEETSLNGRWTWRNQSTTTATLYNGSLIMSPPVGAGENLRIIEQSVSGSWKFRARVSLHGTANYHSCGLCVINSGSGKVMTCSKVYDSGAGNEAYAVSKYTNVTTYSAALLANTDYADRFGSHQQFSYFEIEYDGTTLYFRMSGDGIVFDTVASEAAATFLGAPDKIGIYCNVVNGSSAPVGVVDWFRRIS